MPISLIPKSRVFFVCFDLLVNSLISFFLSLQMKIKYEQWFTVHVNLADALASPLQMFCYNPHINGKISEKFLKFSLKVHSRASLRQSVTTESFLKMMKNVFYFMLKALFFLEIFTFLFWFFGYVEKQLDKKGKVNF